MESKDENITFSVIEEIEQENNFDINELIKELDKKELEQDNSLFIPNMINYTENFTVKDLLLICEYYGISKELKLTKCKKEIIINILVDFESNPMNSEIVFRRQNMWFYINELKNDKFMKKYILW
jgi:hypothetical protein